jgi:hypothetical protein
MQHLAFNNSIFSMIKWAVILSLFWVFYPGMAQTNTNPSITSLYQPEFYVVLLKNTQDEAVLESIVQQDRCANSQKLADLLYRIRIENGFTFMNCQRSDTVQRLFKELAVYRQAKMIPDGQVIYKSPSSRKGEPDPDPPSKKPRRSSQFYVAEDPWAYESVHGSTRFVHTLYGPQDIKRAYDRIDVDSNSRRIVLATIDSSFDSEMLWSTDLAGPSAYISTNPSAPIPETFNHGMAVAYTALAPMNFDGGVGTCPLGLCFWVHSGYSLEETLEGYVRYWLSDVIKAVANVRGLEPNPDIINMSFGGPIENPALRKLIDEITREDGVVVVASAGNDPMGVSAFPASYSQVIAAGAAENGTKTAWTSKGDLYAPGYVTVPNFYFEENESCSEDSCYVYGTSFAAPLIAGVAGTVLREADLSQLQKSETSAFMKNLLTETGYPLNYPKEPPDENPLVTRPLGERHLDANKAVRRVQEMKSPQAIPGLEYGVTEWAPYQDPADPYWRHFYDGTRKDATTVLKTPFKYEEGSCWDPKNVKITVSDIQLINKLPVFEIQEVRGDTIKINAEMNPKAKVAFKVLYKIPVLGCLPFGLGDIKIKIDTTFGEGTPPDKLTQTYQLHGHKYDLKERHHEPQARKIHYDANLEFEFLEVGIPEGVIKFILRCFLDSLTHWERVLTFVLNNSLVGDVEMMIDEITEKKLLHTHFRKGSIEKRLEGLELPLMFAEPYLGNQFNHNRQNNKTESQVAIFSKKFNDYAKGVAQAPSLPEIKPILFDDPSHEVEFYSYTNTINLEQRNLYVKGLYSSDHNPEFIRDIRTYATPSDHLLRLQARFNAVEPPFLTIAGDEEIRKDRWGEYSIKALLDLTIQDETTNSAKMPIQIPVLMRVPLSNRDSRFRALGEEYQFGPGTIPARFEQRITPMQEGTRVIFSPTIFEDFEAAYGIQLGRLLHAEDIKNLVRLLFPELYRLLAATDSGVGVECNIMAEKPWGTLLDDILLAQGSQETYLGSQMLEVVLRDPWMIGLPCLRPEAQALVAETDSDNASGIIKRKTDLVPRGDAYEPHAKHGNTFASFVTHPFNRGLRLPYVMVDFQAIQDYSYDPVILRSSLDERFESPFEFQRNNGYQVLVVHHLAQLNNTLWNTMANPSLKAQPATAIFWHPYNMDSRPKVVEILAKPYRKREMVEGLTCQPRTIVGLTNLNSSYFKNEYYSDHQRTPILSHQDTIQRPSLDECQDQKTSQLDPRNPEPGLSSTAIEVEF